MIWSDCHSSVSLMMKCFQVKILYKLFLSLPAGKIPHALPKHVQTWCESGEVTAAYKYLKELLRLGYGVRCQLRTPEYIHEGPVVCRVNDAAAYERFLKICEHLAIEEEVSI